MGSEKEVGGGGGGRNTHFFLKTLYVSLSEMGPLHLLCGAPIISSPTYKLKIFRLLSGKCFNAYLSKKNLVHHEIVILISIPKCAASHLR